MARVVGHERLQHRGLADAVAADQHDLLAAVDDGAEVVDHLQVAERLRQPLGLERHLARRPVLLEADVGALDVRAREVGGLQPLHFLAPRRRLRRARAGAEALDEVHELRDLLLALRVLGLDARADLRLGHHHVIVAAGIGDDGLVVDVGGVGADRVEEVAVVRDDDERPLVALEKAFEPVNRVEVQVVGGLVEQERGGRSEERLRQQHPHLLAALQLGHLALVQFVGDVEALQQHGGIALGGVAVLLADDPFELAQPHAVLVRHVGLLIEPVALDHRLPQAGVAHDHGVDDAMRVELELVLAQDAELRRTDHGAFLRVEGAGEQLHERGLAGPVGARQPVAAPGRERRGDVLEEHLGAIPHRHAADRNHRESALLEEGTGFKLPILPRRVRVPHGGPVSVWRASPARPTAPARRAAPARWPRGAPACGRWSRPAPCRTPERRRRR